MEHERQWGKIEELHGGNQRQNEQMRTVPGTRSSELYAIDICRHGEAQNKRNGVDDKEESSKSVYR